MGKLSLVVLGLSTFVLGSIESHLWAQSSMKVIANASAPMDYVTARKREHSTVDSQPKVIGGNIADEGEWPWQVALLRSELLSGEKASQYNALFCGGTLISPEWVLTAAHCTFRDNPDNPDEIIEASPRDITVLTGATSLYVGTRHEVAEIVRHPDYDSAIIDNDVALLKLRRPASEEAVKLPTDSSLPPSGTNAWVLGWGLTGERTIPNWLQEARISIGDRAVCNKIQRDLYVSELKEYLPFLAGRLRIPGAEIQNLFDTMVKQAGDPLTPAMICAGTETGERDSCNGDSGGPLVVQKEDRTFYQVGIVSWGAAPLTAQTPCGQPRLYGVYTNLANFVDWIKEQTAR